MNLGSGRHSRHAVGRHHSSGGHHTRHSGHSIRRHHSSRRHHAGHTGHAVGRHHATRGHHTGHSRDTRHIGHHISGMRHGGSSGSIYIMVKIVREQHTLRSERRSIGTTQTTKRTCKSTAGGKRNRSEATTNSEGLSGSGHSLADILEHSLPKKKDHIRSVEEDSRSELWWCSHLSGGRVHEPSFPHALQSRLDSTSNQITGKGNIPSFVGFFDLILRRSSQSPRTRFMCLSKAIKVPMKTRLMRKKHQKSNRRQLEMHTHTSLEG